jgi:hypothetical protein
LALLKQNVLYFGRQDFRRVSLPEAKQQVCYFTFFFLKRRQKICLNLLIKKKRVAQLINGKPSENHYKEPTSNNSQSTQLTNHLGRPTRYTAATRWKTHRKGKPLKTQT